MFKKKTVAVIERALLEKCQTLENINGVLRNEIAELEEENEILQKDVHRFRKEVVDRESTDRKTRMENQKLLCENMELRRLNVTLRPTADRVRAMEEENYRLWSENKLLRAALVKADPEEAKRYG